MMAEEKKSEEKEPYKRPRRRLTEADMKRVNLGKAYWQVRLAGVQDEGVRKVLYRYCMDIVDMIESGSGLVFMGDRGVGKTAAAAVVLKEAIRRGFTAYFATQIELRELVFEEKVFGTGADGVTVNDKIKTVELLVIDGINNPFLVDKAFGPLQLELLVARRNDRKLATIVTTRIGKQFRREEHVTLFDILTETTVALRIDGRNLRDDARNKLAKRVLGE